MTPRDTFDLLRSIFRECEFQDWNSTDSFTLSTLNATLQYDDFRKLRDEGFVATFSDSTQNTTYDNEVEAAVPANSKITLVIPRSAHELAICSSLSNLIAIEGLTEELPFAFIIIGKGMETVYYCRSEINNPLPPLVESYIQAIGLWTLLKREAEHVDQLSSDLLYFSTRRTQISPGFKVSDLQSLKSIGSITDFIECEENNSTRKEIFSAVISEYLQDHDREDSFAVILRSVKIIGKRLREGLAIYLAANSPAKLAAAARTEYLSLSEKLDKLINSIEVKSLAIPAGLLLCAKEAEKGVPFSALNFVLYITVGVFIYVMHKVADTQSNVLSGIKSIIDLTHAEFQNKGLDEQNTTLVVNFQTLSERVTSAKLQLRVTKWASWAPLLGLIVVSVFANPKEEEKTGEPRISQKSATSTSLPPTSGEGGNSKDNPLNTSPQKASPSLPDE